MDAQTSATLQQRLTALIARARQLRVESEELDQEILRLSQIIAGVEPSDGELPAILDEDDDFEGGRPTRGRDFGEVGAVAAPRARLQAAHEIIPN